MGQKRTCLSVDNFVTVNVRKARDMSKVSECCREKAPTLLLHKHTFKLH